MLAAEVFGWTGHVLMTPRTQNQQILKENYAFKSTSAAGWVVMGYPSQGPIVWKLQGRKMTYKQWEAETLANSVTEHK